LPKQQAPFCTYKFNQPKEEEEHRDGPQDGHSHGQNYNPDSVEYQHKDHKFHRVVLGLMIAACVVGFISLLFSFGAFCWKYASLIWCLLNLVSTIVSAAGLIIFFRHSHDKDYRFVFSRAFKRYEQELGIAFWLAAGGCLGFLFSTIMSLIGTVTHFLAERRDENYTRKIVWPKGVHSSAV
jgi:amino acid transporter